MSDAEQGDFKKIPQSLWFSVSLLSTSGSSFLANFQKSKVSRTPTMSTSSHYVRRIISILTPVFKIDGNLDFNIGKTKFLSKGSTVDHVLERAKKFLDTDPDFTDIDHHFTRDMFTTEGIEVVGVEF